jgi:hypothetical protein
MKSLALLVVAIALIVGGVALTTVNAEEPAATAVLPSTPGAAAEPSAQPPAPAENQAAEAPPKTAQPETAASAGTAAAPEKPAPEATAAAPEKPATEATAPAPTKPPTETSTPAPTQPAAKALSAAELDQLLAPIALYPDPLLSQVLMASTYPQEVSEASRWLAVPANRRLTGNALAAALKKRHWAPSVMALVPFADVLQAMSGNIGWTERLGDAFRAQQADVMASVQRLRHQAMQAGTLKTSPECHCIVETKGEVIAIRPDYPQQVFVPICYPPRAYGAWRYPDYPPVILPPPAGIAFAPDIAVAYSGVVLAPYAAVWGWGSVDWERRAIIVDPVRYAALAGATAAFAGNVWMHRPPVWEPRALAASSRLVWRGGPWGFAHHGHLHGWPGYYHVSHAWFGGGFHGGGGHGWGHGWGGGHGWGHGWGGGHGHH